MRSPAILIGICLALAPAALSAQPAPTPAQKKSVPPPPVAQNSGPRAPAQPAPAPNSLFPFKLPGFSTPGTTTAFDGNQREIGRAHV